MLLWRALVRRMEEIPKQQIKGFASGLTIPMLQEAHRICSHPAGLALPIAVVLDCHLEMPFLHKEMKRRAKAIPIASMMVCLDPDYDYGPAVDDPPIVREIVHCLNLSTRPWEDQRDTTPNLQNVSQPPLETDQDGLLKMFEVWRETRRTTKRIVPRLPFPAPDDLLPEERAFWEGPLARAWETSQTVLDKQVSIFSGKFDKSIGRQVRNYASTVRKQDRRRRKIRKREPDQIAAEVHSQPQLADEVLVYAQDYESNEKQVRRLYQRARKLQGRLGVRFLEALAVGKTKEEASAHAGFSPKAGYRLLEKLSKDSS